MLKVLQESNSPWYAKGLRFKCTGCGQCCTGAPGYIWVTEQEIVKIAAYLNISLPEFSRLYLRRVGDRFSLKEHARTYACVFLKEDNKCLVYPVRPTQCGTFPWWPENLQSEQDWLETATRCEGINPEAPLISLETIQEQLAIQTGQSNHDNN